MPDFENPDLQFAVEIVLQASLLVRQVQEEMVTPALMKEDSSPVTVADFACQALVGCLLSQYYPGEPLLAEEDSSSLQQPGQVEMLEQVTGFVRRFIHRADPAHVCTWIDSGQGSPGARFWVLDPIDGTKGFLRGDQYAVALALVVGGRVELGVLGCPMLDENALPAQDSGALFLALRSHGAWSVPMHRLASFQPLQVSQVDTPSQARILRSFESGHTNASKVDLFSLELGSPVEPLRMDSQAKYAVLAAGRSELMLRLLSPQQPDYREKIWDQAAGSILLEEAGGKITDLDGNPLDFSTGRSLLNNRGILASNSVLHTSALQALRQIGA